ncbi:MAG: J domain-containing protein [bacterium]
MNGNGNGESFQDYYELLQVSPNADPETIHRVFRHLAKKYHPDSAGTGDAEQFNLLLNAYRTLTDPEARAGYDLKYQLHWDRKWQLQTEASDSRGFENDEVLREQLLSLFYVQRRRNLRSPGIGEAELSRLIRCPIDLLEFHVWYMREKGWILRTETGLFAITALGVDRVEQDRVRLRADRLIEARGSHSEDNGDGEPKELAA